MPRINTDAGLSLPFGGALAITRHCSHQGAQKALPRANTQAWLVLLAIKEHGPLTDHQIVEKTGLPLNVVNARRNVLAQKDLIHAHGWTTGPSGVKNTLWKFGGQDVRKPA